MPSSNSQYVVLTRVGFQGGEDSIRDFILLGDKKARMSKSTRLEALVKQLSGHVDTEACYQAYFLCFNDIKYYEAHDVLEYAWLKFPEKGGVFFKGLIQLAGAFVHLQKQYFRPHHYKFGSRLRPAQRLLWRASKNLQSYLPRYMRLDVATVLQVCEFLEGSIAASGYQRNPWRPENAPRFEEDAKVWRLQVSKAE